MSEHVEHRRPTSSVGVPFGRYKIRRRLGRGGMGEVFLADQMGPRGPVRQVALKRMLPSLAGDPEVVQSFLDEMATAAKLNHPNIATTYDFGEADGTYYFAMEYIEGATLDAILRASGPLPIGAALHVAIAIARALECAHGLVDARGRRTPVVHRDVSPHNIMVSNKGEVKLLDFGIAKAEAAVLGERVRAKRAYASPEQLRGSSPDRRFDLWSLGVVLYECATGRRPFEGDDAREIVEAAEAGRHRAIDEERADASLIASLVSRALEPVPERRWPSATAFLGACLELESTVSSGDGRGLAQLARSISSGERQESIDLVPRTETAAIIPRGDSPPSDATEPRASWTTGDEALVGRMPRVARVFAAMSALAVLAVAGWWQLRATAPNDAVVADAVRDVAHSSERDLSRGTSEDPKRVEPATPEPSRETVADVVRAQSVNEDAGARASTPVRGPTRSAAQSSRAPPPERAKTPEVAPSRDPVEPRAPSRVHDVAGFGLLSVRTTPWARIEIDGAVEGEGILAEKALVAGQHRLRLIPGRGEFPARVVDVEVRAGARTVVFVDFASDRVSVERR